MAIKLDIENVKRVVENDTGVGSPNHRSKKKNNEKDSKTFGFG